eukprot:gene8160-9692_t
MQGLPEQTPPKTTMFVTKEDAPEDDSRLPWLLNSSSLVYSAYDFRTCAVVGNSGILRRREYGASIDSHTFVMRSNQAPVRTYQRQVGSKTTLRLLNKLWTEKYSGKDGVGERTPSRPEGRLLAHGSGRRIDPAVLPVESNVTLLASRVDAPLVTKMHEKFSAKRKDVRVLSLATAIPGGSKKLMELFRDRQQHCTGRAVDGPVTPSSGLLAVYMLMYLCEKVSVYGFGTDRRSPYQYYRFFNTERRAGASEVHSFDHEYKALLTLSRDGYVTLCTAMSKPNCGLQRS